MTSAFAPESCVDLRFSHRLVCVITGQYRSSRGPAAAQTEGGTGVVRHPSVGLVPRWVIGDAALTHLDHSHLMLLQILFEFGNVLPEEFDCVQLMASQEHVAAERELPATFRGLGIVGDQDRSTVVGVDGNGIVVGGTETRLDDGPAFVTSLPQKRSNSVGIDVFVEHESHLGNRRQPRPRRLDVLLSEAREGLHDLPHALPGLHVALDRLDRYSRASKDRL